MNFLLKQTLLGLKNILPYFIVAIYPTFKLLKMVEKNDLLGASTPSRSNKK